jgi:formate dehydrogenase subunit gamma
MPPSDRVPQPAPQSSVQRFGRLERIVHWTNATLFLFLIVTGFSLRGAPVFRELHYRGAVKFLHLWVGYALPVPVLLGMVGHIGAPLRDDFRRIARWTADDTRWWRRASRPAAMVGKFNPGQKLNAAFIGSCIIVFPVTGTVMRWANTFPEWMRTGADFTHVWFAIFLLVVTIGHITMAATRPMAMRAITTGTVDAAWARHEHPRWYAEMRAATQPTAADPDSLEIVSDEVGTAS